MAKDLSPAAIAAVVLVALPLVADPFGWNQHAALRFAVLAVAATAGAVDALRRRWRPPAALRTPMVAVAAVATVSTVVAWSPADAVLGDSTRRFGLVTSLLLLGAFVTGASVAPEHRRVVLRGAALTAVATAAVLAASAATGSARWRAAGVGNTGELGGWALLLLGAAAALVVAEAPGSRWRLLGIAAAVAAAGLVAVSGSQMAIGAALATGAVLLAPRRQRVVVAVAVVVAAVVAGAVWHDDVEGRAAGWSVAVDAIADRPLLGWGPDNGRVGLVSSLDDGFTSRYGSVPVQDRAHNGALDEALRTGVLGAAALAWLVVAAGRTARDGDPSLRLLRVGVVAHLVFLAGWFPSLGPAAAVAVLGGMAIAPANVPTAEPRRWRAAAVAAVAVAAAVGTYVVVADHRVDRSFEDLADATAASAAADVAASARAATDVPGGFLERLAVVDLAVAVGHPDGLLEAREITRGSDDPVLAVADAELLHAYARATDDVADLDAAIARYRQAIALAPSQAEPWLGLGEALVERGDLAAAEPALARAAALLPRDPAPLVDLAYVALAVGDGPAAADARDRACGVAPGDPQVLRMAAAVAAAGFGTGDCR